MNRLSLLASAVLLALAAPRGWSTQNDCHWTPYSGGDQVQTTIVPHAQAQSPNLGVKLVFDHMLHPNTPGSVIFTCAPSGPLCKTAKGASSIKEPVSNGTSGTPGGAFVSDTAGSYTITASDDADACKPFKFTVTVAKSDNYDAIMAQKAPAPAAVPLKLWSDRPVPTIDLGNFNNRTAELVVKLTQFGGDQVPMPNQAITYTLAPVGSANCAFADGAGWTRAATTNKLGEGVPFARITGSGGAACKLTASAANVPSYSVEIPIKAAPNGVRPAAPPPPPPPAVVPFPNLDLGDAHMRLIDIVSAKTGNTKTSFSAQLSWNVATKSAASQSIDFSIDQNASQPANCRFVQNGTVKITLTTDAKGKTGSVDVSGWDIGGCSVSASYAGVKSALYFVSVAAPAPAKPVSAPVTVGAQSAGAMTLKVLSSNASMSLSAKPKKYPDLSIKVLNSTGGATAGVEVAFSISDPDKIGCLIDGDQKTSKQTTNTTGMTPPQPVTADKPGTCGIKAAVGSLSETKTLTFTK